MKDLVFPFDFNYINLLSACFDKYDNALGTQKGSMSVIILCWNM